MNYLFGVLISLFGLSTLYAQTTETFTTNGVFTVPAGVTEITVECWGAGGGGGRSSSCGAGRGGGGGGAYARSILTVSPGQQFNFTVGTGGTGGNLTALANSGGATNFGGGLVIAVGGGGVDNNSNTAGAGGLAANCTFNDVAFNGGNGAAGSGGNSGGGGGGAGTNNPGNAGSGTTAGTGGASNGGNGGAGRTNGGDGNNGANFGGGGGGGRTGNSVFGACIPSTANGGAGGSGVVRITYTFPACSGTPTAGTINPSSLNVSSGQTFSLTLDGFSANLQGITFQWQSSTNPGGPFTNIAGATNASLTVSGGVSATTYYQVVVTCANSG